MRSVASHGAAYTAVSNRAYHSLSIAVLGADLHQALTAAINERGLSNDDKIQELLLLLEN